ncbi:hypothetical protein JCM11641_003141 [Rhodosporidiobolus odoratus]
MGKKSNQARFPLARIKKMIQADEDVGKVAQATPVVVSKSIELFLASLIDACVKDAEQRQSNKLTPWGLKRAINATPTLDFCADIVESIPDPLEGEEDEKPKKKRAPKKKKQIETDEEELEDEDEEEKPRKKKATAAGKKGKKGQDEDYEEDQE